MKLQTLPLIALLAGVILIIMSFVWLGVRRGTGEVWSAADEAEYSAATERWRALGHSHDPQEGPSAAEAQRITEEFNAQREKFQNAEGRGRLLSSVFWYIGVLLLFLGGGGVFALRFMEEDA